MTSLKQSAQCSPCFKCWHPLLPSFSARLIFALRTLLGIACCATFTLSSFTSTSIQDQLLLGVGFIVSIQNTLGATIQTVGRIFLAGLITTIYCLCIVNYCPKDIYFAVGATNIFVFLIVYTDLPANVRRYSILPTCIILLQWFKKPHINTIYILHIWASMSFGAILAILVLCIPLPLFPTAYRELTIRMKFTSRQIRREIAAIILLISEYHNIHLSDKYNPEIYQNKPKTSVSDEDGIEIPINTYREDDFYNYSTSFENLKDDHLLKSDIQDLHSLVNEEFKEIERSLTEISYEPYFILLKLLNLTRKIFSHIPFLKKFFKKSSTLQTRLEIWATGLASLQRTITGMLSLDHHHHAFVGQRQLINAISLLLDSTFNFLDSTLPYTTSSSKYINPVHIMSCREKIEESLEHFFETYAQLYENPRQTNMSNTDSIRLNTFLLLILRIVHVSITTAETSETPGARLDIGVEQTLNTSSIIKKKFNWKKPFYALANYIGLKPSSGKFLRAMKTSLSVLVSAIVVLTFRERLQAYGWVYWAPMTTALVSNSSEGGTLRLSFQRLMAVLLGSTYAYIIFLVGQDHLVIGISISLFVAFMGYIKTDPQKEYFASVCAQSASIITFISNQEGLQGSNKAVLARTSLTFLGIFIHVLISNLFVPISARGLIKKKVLIMLKSVSLALKSTTDDFCSFIGPTINPSSNDQQTTSFNLMNTLAETEHIADDFPALLEEALSEPNFWKRPFIEVKDRYDDISKALKRIMINIRFIRRCTTILQAESKLHFAHEAKWQIRRSSALPNSNHANTEMKTFHSWTMTELRKQKHLQNDLDIPLTIFMTYAPRSPTQLGKKSLASNSSSVSLRLNHTKLYQPVLEHISTLEKYIQQVLSLTGQLIEKQATVDVGSFELHELYREDSFDGQQKKSLNRRPSFYHATPFESIPIANNHFECCSCCHIKQQKDDQPLPSLRNAVDLMLASLIQFLYANNRFIRTELVSIQSIGDILAFHTLSYALKDMVEATTDLAKNARRIKHIDTRTLTHTDDDEKIL